ncbi:hypothetical protein G9A89_003408 [Geosiphon pyriformis]|nr:hypothetical protein G9A89_003408 [Geosiphon pyriformis]
MNIFNKKAGRNENFGVQAKNHPPESYNPNNPAYHAPETGTSYDDLWGGNSHEEKFLEDAAAYDGCLKSSLDLHYERPQEDENIYRSSPESSHQIVQSQTKPMSDTYFISQPKPVARPPKSPDRFKLSLSQTQYTPQPPQPPQPSQYSPKIPHLPQTNQYFSQDSHRPQPDQFSHPALHKYSSQSSLNSHKTQNPPPIIHKYPSHSSLNSQTRHYSHQNPQYANQTALPPAPIMTDHQRTELVNLLLKVGCFLVLSFIIAVAVIVIIGLVNYKKCVGLSLNDNSRNNLTRSYIDRSFENQPWEFITSGKFQSATLNVQQPKSEDNRVYFETRMVSAKGGDVFLQENKEQGQFNFVHGTELKSPSWQNYLRFPPICAKVEVDLWFAKNTTFQFALKTSGFIVNGWPKDPDAL